MITWDRTVSVLAGGVGAIGAGVAVVTGVAASAIGTAGLFGTTVGATGLTGLLMSAGLIESTPVWVPAAIGGVVAGLGYGALKYWRLKAKVEAVPEGEETSFSESEAKLVERIVRRVAKRVQVANK